MKKWIKELCPEISDWQAELIAEVAQKRVAAEREVCATIIQRAGLPSIADAIRARGKDAESSKS